MRLPRYRFGARCYDVLSLEPVLYRGGRLAAIGLADPRPGDRVLDVGCGTGLSFAPVLAALGDTGRLVGVDASAAMLRRARRRVERHGWRRVELVHADARRLPPGPFDVILFCYSLSIVDGWPAVWRGALARLAPGGRVAVVDTAYPTGAARVLTPLAWLLLAAGGVRPGRRVWEAVGRDTAGVRRRELLARHVRVAAGTRR